MSDLKFADTHNLVMFLEKPTKSVGFEEIVDFLNAHTIKYALTINPTIYTSCIEQFLATAKVKTVNGEYQLQALVDGKKVIITETSVRRDLHLEDAEGTGCLPTATIFEELTKMRYEKLTQKLTFYKAFFSPQWKYLIHTILQCLSAKTTAWNEFSITMASIIICLATNQKFNFSKYIFDNMVKNLEGGVKFMMYPRFVQVFVNKQVGDMSHHKRIFVTPSHTKKVFGNMKREGKGFSGRVTLLFQTMIVQAHKEMGEGSANPTDPHHTPIITQPSTSQPQKKQPRRKQRKDTKLPQPSGPTEPIVDETENVESVPIHSNDQLLSGEDRLKLNELMDLCTKLQQRVLDLENASLCLFLTSSYSLTFSSECVKKIFKYLKGQPKLGLWWMSISGQKVNFMAVQEADYCGYFSKKPAYVAAAQLLCKTTRAPLHCEDPVFHLRTRYVIRHLKEIPREELDTVNTAASRTVFLLKAGFLLISTMVCGILSAVDSFRADSVYVPAV
ncbi:hypothetical protein Tco_0650321 [Tanacetum coccineum]